MFVCLCRQISTQIYNNNFQQNKSKMKLSEKAITEVRGSRRIINLLAVEHDCNSRTVERWAETNEANGDLTKITSLKVISKETGLKQSEILVD